MVLLLPKNKLIQDFYLSLFPYYFPKTCGKLHVFKLALQYQMVNNLKHFLSNFKVSLDNILGLIPSSMMITNNESLIPWERPKPLLSSSSEQLESPE